MALRKRPFWNCKALGDAFRFHGDGIEETFMGTVILPASLEHLKEALAFLETKARAAGLDEKRALEMSLALEEVLVNIFTYAYPRERGVVEIRCSSREPGRLAVEVRDQGVPFNCLSWREPDLERGIEDRPIGGLGIFLFRRLASRVEYRREADTNILSLLF